jgi:Fe2+ or Zn2+ uptake regulation protein
MRQTRQRQAVWTALGRLQSHSTADEIVAEVRRLEPGFSRSTVYRALEALTASGAARAVRLGQGPVRYERSGEEHQHAVCQLCEGVFHLEHELVAELERHLEQHHRFRPLRTEVLVSGVCDACSRAGRPRNPRKRTLDHVHFD